MKIIAILFSLLFVIAFFAACKNNDVYLSETDSSTPADTSSGFQIIITDKQETVSGTESKASSTAPTQSEIAEIASDWDDVEIEIEAAPESKPEKTSSKETAVSSEEKAPTSSLQANPSSEQETPSESSSEQPIASEEPTASKVTSLPDYYEGRY